MNDTTLATLAGVVLSLAFSYVPGLKGKFEALNPDFKRLIMLGALLLVTLAIYGLSCIGYSNQVTCDKSGILALVNLFISAAIANQAAYLLTVRP
jgi:hypothetical protein